MTRNLNPNTTLETLRARVTLDHGDRFSISASTVRIHVKSGKTYDVGPIEFVENVLNAELPKGWRLHYEENWIITESDGEPDLGWDACQIEVDEFMTAQQIQAEIDLTIHEHDWDRAPFWVDYPDGWDFDGIDQGPALVLFNKQSEEALAVPVTEDMNLKQMQAAIDAAFAVRE